MAVKNARNASGVSEFRLVGCVRVTTMTFDVFGMSEISMISIKVSRILLSGVGSEAGFKYVKKTVAHWGTDVSSVAKIMDTVNKLDNA